MKNWKRTFAIIFSGQLVSLVSSSVVGYAIIFWLSLTTQSPRVMAWATFASFMPQAVLGILAGVYVDRWRRKRVMIAADGFIALCTLALFALMMSGATDYAYFYLLFACRSIGSAFHSPALQASVPLIAPPEELTRVAGINQTIQSLSGIVAPVLGAALISLTDIKYILLLDVAGAAVAITTLLFVTIPNPEKSDTKPDVWRELGECFTVIRSRKGLPFVFFVFMLVNLVIMPAMIMFPLITVSHFGGGAYQMSIVEMCWGVGALVGGALLGTRRVRSNYIVLMNVMNLFFGAYCIVTGVLPPSGFVIFAFVTAIGGLCSSICFSLFSALLQRIIDAAVLGRVFSLFFSITMLPSIIGIIGSGFLADTIGIPQTFLYSGIVIVVIGAFSFFVKDAIRLGRVQDSNEQ